MCTCTRWFHDRGVDEPPAEYFEKRHPLRYWGLRLTLIGLLVYFFAQHPAFAEPLPRAHNDGECQLVADVVWAARSMHKHGIAPAIAEKVLMDFYASTPIEDRLPQLVPAAVRLAQQFRKESPHELAPLDMRNCMRARGDLSVIFGTDS